MRLWLFLLPLFFSLPSWAFDDTKVAQKLNLDTGVTGSPWTFLGTNSVFVNEDFSRQLMVVRNVPGKIGGTQFIEADGYLIVNIPEGKETFTSIAVVGITKDALLPYLDSFSFRKFFSLIPEARADVCDTPGMAQTPGLQALTAFFTTGAGAGFARCLMNFAQGAWSATGGAVGSFIEGVGNLVRDPRGFWNRRVEQMNKMWQFMRHFRSQMSGMMAQVRGLPQETINQIMCGFLGGIGAGAAVALITAGAGIGPLLARVTSYVSKIAGMARVFTLFSSMGRLSSIPGRFYEGIANGRIGENVIDRMDSFARNRMDRMVEGAMRCAL